MTHPTHSIPHLSHLQSFSRPLYAQKPRLVFQATVGVSRASFHPEYTGRVARSYKTEAVVLRSFRFGEADRVLHLYTLDRGRVGAVAKGVRKTKSRFGARLEPLSHVELLLHQGSGELHTVTGASLLDPHRPAREDAYRLSVGLVGAEAMLRLYVEQEQNERAFEALTRFLIALDAVPGGLRGRASLDSLALAFQLKLLWLSGYLPHLEACVECGATEQLLGYLPSAGGAVCAACAPSETVALAPEGFRGVQALLMSPLADVHGLALGDRATRDALAVIVTSYEYHGGFRLRTLSA
jgi:DNA repair protein RecO (recombination protein O)